MLRRECSSSPHPASMDGWLSCCLASVDIECVDKICCFEMGLRPCLWMQSCVFFAELIAGKCENIVPESLGV